MQPSSSASHNSTSHELKPTRSDQADSPSLPPPYPSVIYKISDYSPAHYNDASAPPSYADVNSPSVVYINNYPGPPLTDGATVQIQTNGHRFTEQLTTIDARPSRRLQRFVIINGVLTIIFGLVIAGLQIALIASHSIVYYYFGFWAGALIVSIGISTLMFYSRHQTYDLQRYFRSFLWQTIFVAIVFVIGIIIILTDTCDDKASNRSSDTDACHRSHKILNGFQLAVLGLVLLQSFVNVAIIGILKRCSTSTF